MKGVEIIFRGETINITPEFKTSILIYNRNGQYQMEASGLDRDMMSYSWIDSEIKSGEIIDIEIKDIDRGSEPISKKMAFCDPVKLTPKEIEIVNAERLDYFFALEKILKEENLL